MNPLDSGEIFDLALMNPNPTSSKTKEGPVYRVSFELDQDTWQMFMDGNTKGMVLAAKAAVVPDIGDDPVEAKKERDVAALENKRDVAEYGAQSQLLFRAGFFYNKIVHRNIAPDSEFLQWIRSHEDKCAVKKLGNCAGATEAAHVRRISEGAGTGIKPEYSAIPLCSHHHREQHQHGESAIGGRDKVDKLKAKYVAEWAKDTLKAQLGFDSWRNVPPDTLRQWCGDIAYLIPKGYE